MIHKAYSKTGDSCRVTFQISAEEAAAQSAVVLGEFNDWELRSHPLDRQEDGSFRLTVALPAGRDYRFRYLLDGERWQNDTGADDYRFNQFGSQDSILDLSAGSTTEAAPKAVKTVKAAKAPKAAKPAASPAPTVQPSVATKAAPGRTSAKPAKKAAAEPAAAAKPAPAPGAKSARRPAPPK